MAEPVDMRLVRSQRSLLDAIRLCIALGKVAEKALCIDLGIDAGQWSRIMSGGANLPPEILVPIMERAGNDVPFLWIADALGYDVESLRPKETETQRDLRIANATIERLEAERRAERALLDDVLSKLRPQA